MIDRGLGTVQSRELVSTSEVADLLLDLRLLLMSAAADADAHGRRRFLTPPSAEGEQLLEALLDAGPQQLRVVDRGAVDVQPHVEAAVVATAS